MESIILGIIILIIYIFILYYIASQVRDTVDMKGYNAKSMHIFAWCFWLPVLGIPYAASLPDIHLRNKCVDIEKQNEKLLNELNNLNARLNKTEATTITLPAQRDELPEL